MRTYRAFFAHAGVLLAVAAPSGAQLLSSKLLYNAIQPCRVLDTRGHHGPVAPGTPYTFAVVGNGDLSVQGGSATGCAIPGFANGKPQALAVMINFVAVGAQGAGDLRAFPSDGSLPNSSVLNYSMSQLTGGLNIANGISVPLGQTTQGQDLTVQVDVSATQVVADVVGYFTKATRRFYLSGAPGGIGTTGAGTTLAGVCAQGFHFASIDEILNPALLTYDASQAMAVTTADRGSGAPHGSFGWVRTGWDSSTTAIVGQGNCATWASSSAAASGSAVALSSSWSDAAIMVSPYKTQATTCNNTLFVWCVED